MARTIYDRPTRALLKEMVEDLGLRPGQVFTTSRALQWFEAKYPPMATSNSPTYGQSNSSMQDERIMRHRR